MKFKPTIPASRKAKPDPADDTAQSKPTERAGSRPPKPRVPRELRQRKPLPAVEVAGIFSHGLGGGLNAGSSSGKPTETLGNLQYDTLAVKASNGVGSLPLNKSDTLQYMNTVSTDESDDNEGGKELRVSHPSFMPEEMKSKEMKPEEIKTAVEAAIASRSHAFEANDNSRLIGEFIMKCISSRPNDNSAMDVDWEDENQKPNQNSASAAAACDSRQPFIVQLPTIFPLLDGGDSGQCGELVVYKSGKTVLNLFTAASSRTASDSDDKNDQENIDDPSSVSQPPLAFNIHPGASCKFHQRLAVVENMGTPLADGLPRLIDLGNVDSTKFIVTPDLDNLLLAVKAEE